MATQSNQYAFPEALLQQPRCIVALAGLDVRNNAVHRMVWEMFTVAARSGERKPVSYKHVRADYLYPKRSSEVNQERRGSTVLLFYYRPLLFLLYLSHSTG